MCPVLRDQSVNEAREIIILSAHESSPYWRPYIPAFLTMSVRVQLVRPFAHFTNLDHITGNVILNLTTEESVSAIIVKLEGESRTRLAGPRSAVNDRPDRNKTEIEVHKVSEYLHGFAYETVHFH